VSDALSVHLDVPLDQDLDYSDFTVETAADCGAAYQPAPDHIKRTFNQAFFEKIFVVQIVETLADVKIETQLREPFDVLLGDDLRQSSQKSSSSRKSKKPAGADANGLQSSTPGTFFRSRV
jgi:hypothetical protein